MVSDIVSLPAEKALRLMLKDGAVWLEIKSVRSLSIMHMASDHRYVKLGFKFLIMITMSISPSQPTDNELEAVIEAEGLIFNSNSNFQFIDSLTAWIIFNNCINL